MNLRLRSGVALVAVAVVVTTGACGVDAGRTAQQAVSAGASTGLAASYLSGAAQATQDVRTEQVWGELVVTDGSGQVVSTVTTEGALDAEAGRGRLSVAVAGDLGAGGLLDAEDLGAEVVYDGDTVYVRSPLLELFTGDQPWLAVRSDRFAELAAGLGGSVQSQPDGLLGLLEDLGGRLEEVGEEEVRGVATRHVRTEVEVQALLDEASPERRERLERHLDEIGVDLAALASIPVDAWVDGDDLVRRVRVRYDLGTLPGAGEELAGTTMTQTVELFGFDEPVEIQVPDPSEVGDLDLDGLLGELLGD